MKGCFIFNLGGIIKKDDLPALRLNLSAMHQLWTDARSNQILACTRYTSLICNLNNMFYPCFVVLGLLTIEFLIKRAHNICS